MTWIEPLQLETWLIQVFSGTNEIFTAIALLVIMSIAGYFRLRGAGLFFMIGILLFMFTGVVPLSLIALVSIFGGLAIGYSMANVIQR